MMNHRPPRCLAVIFCLFVATGPRGLQAQTGADLSVLHVRGTAEVRVAPDLATVRLGVASEAPTAQEAQLAVNRAIDAILGAVRDVGIDGDRIQTVQLRLTPVFSSRRPGDDREPGIVGYRAANTVSVRIEDMTLIAPVIDVALDAGANRLEGVAFGLQDDENVRERALRQAVGEARAKADAIADALDMQVGSVIAVTEEPGFVRPPSVELSRAMAVQADPQTQVAPGVVTVAASVSIEYRLRP